MGRTVARRLIAAGLVVGLAIVLVPQPAAAAAPAPATSGTDWSRAMVESTMTRFTPDQLGPWSYPEGLYLYGQYLVFKRTGDRRYLDYIKAWVDRFVGPDGTIRNSFNSLDSMRSGTLLLILFKETHDPRYKTAADQIRRRLDTYPRTADGGFWHATSRQHQLWADGTYMVLPFLAEYGIMFGDSAFTDNEVVKQLLTYASHLQMDNGLLRHAFDEARAQPWADPVTGLAPEHWCRAIGWFGMATVDVLEILPWDDPGRDPLIAVLRKLIDAFVQFQDPATGRWFQIVDKGQDPNNWTETSCSSMYTFTIARAVLRGYVGRFFAANALKGYQGVLDRISLGPDGLTNLTEICIGTNVGDAAYYLARQRATNDLHGLGSFLIMNELLRYRNEYQPATGPVT